jgi:hypothetical protein
MPNSTKSIRPFIGAKDFNLSKSFYKDLGFEESIISINLSYFKIEDNIGFYLQDAYLKDWVDNTMLFIEVENVEQHYNKLKNLELEQKYKDVRLIPVKKEAWGSECFLHDPSGILWHFGAFDL